MKEPFRRLADLMGDLLTGIYTYCFEPLVRQSHRVRDFSA